MPILLTNDDGIRAPGIVALHRALLDVDGCLGGPVRDGDGKDEEILVVAPLTVQSATSHGVTFHEPLMTRDVPMEAGGEGIAVDGRPADCVKLAVANLWPDRFGKATRPDVLISGMNAGANCGVNVIYSGTVAAAIEGAFLGIPSIAVSLMLRGGRPRFDVASGYARRVIDWILSSGLLTRHGCINVNIPVTEEDGPMPPLVVCPMNTHGLVDAFQKRTNPAGEEYYWAAGDGLDFHATEPDSDVAHLFERRITLTPLCFDLTRHDDVERWSQALSVSRPS